MKLRNIPYNGNWSYNVMTYPTAAITNEEYNRRLKQASDSFCLEDGEGDLMKKTILISGENLNYILDDLEEQLKDMKLPEAKRQSIEAMLETFSDAKGSMEYCFIIHFGLPLTYDKAEAYRNMQKIRTGYEKKLNELGIGTVLIKDESDILNIIDGILTGEFYIGARMNEGKLIPVSRHNKFIKDHDIALLAAPDDIEVDPNGHYVYINNQVVASSILVGRQNLNVSFQSNFNDNFTKNWSVDELINISKKENTAVIWCHVEIPITGERHNQMFKDRLKMNEQSDLKSKDGDMNTSNEAINEYAGKKLKQNIEAAMRGERYVHFALIGLVMGRTKENVDEVINKIGVKLKDGGIKSVRPRRGHLFALRMCLPTNYIHSEFLHIVTSSTSAALLPLRDNTALDEQEGVIVCRDALTKKPFRICPSLKNPDNTLIVTPTGNGKTGFTCAWAGRVVDAGDRAYMVMPKHENRNTGNTKGTDYKTYCEIKGGELVDFSNDDLIPGLLVIPFDKKLFGNKKWAYQMSADMHYDYVEAAVGAWIGRELTPGMKISQSKRLKKLYQDRGILDANGRVINVEDWDNPHKIVWPKYEEIREMIWATRNPKTNIIPNASDRALYEATAKAGAGMPYDRYINSTRRIQPEKDLVVFDLSGLPQNLSNAYCIYLMEYINLSYLPKDPDQPAKRTYVFWDEIHDLMENEVTAPELEKGARKGRAELVTSIFSTQDTVLPNDKFKTLKANCRNVFLFCNLNDTNIDDVMKAFNVDERYREGLKRQGYEIAYLLRDGFTRDVQLSLTKFEKKWLFGEGETEEISESEPVTVSGFAVDPVVQDILDYEGFFNEDDVISGALPDYEPEFKYYNLQNPFGPGSENCWIKRSHIKEATKPGNQDIIGPEGQGGVEGHTHYGMGCMVLAWMRRHPWAFPNARYDHTGGPDLVWGEFDAFGNLIKDCENSGCIEIEVLDSHTLTGWNEKVDRATEAGYKNIIFTGDGAVCRKMKTAKPPDGADYINKVKPYVYPQGTKLLRELERIASEEVNRKPANLSRLQAVTESMEEGEAVF
jgi:hypothetical protein